MSEKAYIGSQELFERTLDLLSSCPLGRLPVPPKPVKWRDEAGAMVGWVFGPVSRPVFQIDESELPY